jgi:hypothetical protein
MEKSGYLNAPVDLPLRKVVPIPTANTPNFNTY